MLGWTARAAVVLVSSAGSRCALIGQLLGWPRPHSRSHTALRVKGASGARGNSNQAPLWLLSSHTDAGGAGFVSETTPEGKKGGKSCVCGLYTAWILHKERPRLVLELTPLHDEQVTDRAVCHGMFGETLELTDMALRGKKPNTGGFTGFAVTVYFSCFLFPVSACRLSNINNNTNNNNVECAPCFLWHGTEVVFTLYCSRNKLIRFKRFRGLWLDSPPPPPAC